MSSVFAAKHKRILGNRRMQDGGCQCLTTGLATNENECEGLGDDVEQCESKAQCHWGPEQNEKCMYERNNFHESQQECHCLTTGSETSELECQGQNFGAKQCESKAQCHWGPTENKKCLNERKHVDKRRQLRTPTLNEIGASLNEIGACMGGGACGLAMAASCAAIMPMTAGASCFIANPLFE